MSLFSSFIIDPLVRARRFSSATPRAASESERRPLSHVNHDTSLTLSSISLDGNSESTVDALEGHGQGDEPPSTLTGRLGEHTPFIYPSRSAAVVDEGQQSDDGTPHHSFAVSSAPIDVSSDVVMSSNPSRALDAQLRALDLDPPLSATPSPSNVPSVPSPAPAPHERDAPGISESLPADDGMRLLRARIHQIRDMNIDEADKARMMHSVMTERYNILRPTSPSSFVLHDRPFTPTSSQSIFSDILSSPVSVSAASEVDPDNPFNLRPGDTEPTYRPRSVPDHADNGDNAVEDDDPDGFEEEATLGCQHYKRNVKVQCYGCRRWYTCRHCHDAVEDHNLDRKKTQNMLCMACGTPQKAAEYCAHCETQSACYYCDICKLWDNNSNKKIYHCADCGICRRGEGLGKDYVHCKVRLYSLYARHI